jgi:hypothetical protein
VEDEGCTGRGLVKLISVVLAIWLRCEERSKPEGAKVAGDQEIVAECQRETPPRAWAGDKAEAGCVSTSITSTRHSRRNMQNYQGEPCMDSIKPSD